MLRAFLPRGTPIVAMSATLAAPIQSDVMKKLEFGTKPDDYVFVNIGNDRPNVAMVVRAIEHPINSYADMNFIIPDNVEQPKDIPLTMVYADTVPQSPEIVDHLERLLPAGLCGTGLVRPFNAAFGADFRTAVLKAFKEGSVRVLVCTNAAGMVSKP